MAGDQRSSLEAFLAHLYAHPAALETFLRAPEDAIAEARLDADDAAAMRAVDRVGLAMAARGYSRKRDSRHGRRG